MESKTSDSSLPRAPVKKENEEEIKEFAETAMNELLGWYGYEGLELRRWAASRARDHSSPEQSEHKNKDECTWCNKRTREGGAIQHAGSTYCSELCFSQSRRANFKRAKTCDWCRHVRHTVAYVDFQDGATQLQFCSDKCLNQYKMHIFCRETQAHLDLNPHLVTAASSSSLITPDLWLKNCRSRSASPDSEKSASPNPETSRPKPSTSSEKTESTSQHRTGKAHPLITVASPAKLMKKGSEEKTRKSPEAKKDGRLKMNLRKRRTSKCSATVTSQSLRQRASTPKAQDLRMQSPTDGPSPVPTVNSVINSPPHLRNNTNPHQLPPPHFPNPMYGMPPVFLENGHEIRHPMFPPRLPNFLPRPVMPVPSRPGLPLNFPQSIGQPPPVTVLVPYPVLLPIPLPIPVPIPMSAFLQAHCLNKVKTETKDDTEGPLDFTINGDKKKEVEKTSDPPETVDRTSKETSERLEAPLEEDNAPAETESGNPEQTLPKFKITRLGNKMAKIVAKPRDVSESNRPLRKRRRLVDVVTEDDPLISKNRKTVEV